MRVQRVAACRRLAAVAASRLAAPWSPSRSRRRSPSRARRSSSTSPTSPTTRSSPTTSCVDWHLTREDSYGRGAGARFRVEVALRPLLLRRRHAHRGRAARSGIVAAGRAGRFNRIRTLSTWTLEEAGRGQTKRHVRDASPTPGAAVRPAHGGSCAGALATTRRHQRALDRLRSILEDGEQRGAHTTVAGGARKPASRLQAVDFPPPCPAAPPLAALARPARRSGGLAACGNQHDEDARQSMRIETEGLYLDARRAEVPGAGLAPAQPRRHRGPALPRRASRAESRELEARRGLVRRVPARRERGRGPLNAVAATSRSSTRRRTSSSRSALEATQRLRLPLDRPIPGRRAHPAARHARPPSTPIQGALLLFKLTLDALDNRPLELKIESATAAADRHHRPRRLGSA